MADYTTEIAPRHTPRLFGRETQSLTAPFRMLERFADDIDRAVPAPRNPNARSMSSANRSSIRNGAVNDCVSRPNSRGV